MPKLRDEERESLSKRVAASATLWDRARTRYWAVSCRWCNWASNGETIDSAIAANREHERGHPELGEYAKLILTPLEIVARIHDHDCKFAPCPCKCGCGKEAGCLLILGPLCRDCDISAGRGDSEHGSMHECN